MGTVELPGLTTAAAHITSVWAEGDYALSLHRSDGAGQREYRFDTKELRDAKLQEIKLKMGTNPQIQSTQELSMKSAMNSVIEAIKPYRKPIMIFIALYLLDHFLLRGAITNRLTQLGHSLAERLLSVLDGTISRIGGKPNGQV